MTAFRDEHTALLERLARLEEDLADAKRRGADSTAIVRELDELAARVSEATARARADHDALAEIGSSIDRMRRAVAPAEAPAPPPSAKAPAPDGSPVGWVAAGAVVVVLVIIGYLASAKSPPPPPAPAAVPDTLDPTAELARARASALDAGLPQNGALTSIKVQYASSDGLVHLHDPHYSASVEYDFSTPRAPLTPPDPSAPLGAPAHEARRSLDFGETVAVTFDGSGVHTSPSVMFVFGNTGSDPHCSVADVWKAAIGAGAPRDAVASLTYERANWHFAIASTRYEYDVSDADCRVRR